MSVMSAIVLHELVCAPAMEIWTHDVAAAQEASNFKFPRERQSRVYECPI